MLSLTKWFCKKSEELEHEGDDDMYNEHTLRGCVKYFLSGCVEGLSDAMILSGIILAIRGIITLITDSKTNN